MKIKFLQVVEFFNWDGDNPVPVKSPEALEALHGVTYDEESCSDYLLDGEEEKNKLGHLNISGGLIRFEYSKDTKSVFISTEYTSSSPLTQDEIDCLMVYTGDQWTDGIGSGLTDCLEFPGDPSIGGNYGEITCQIHS